MIHRQTSACGSSAAGAADSRLRRKSTYLGNDRIDGNEGNDVISAGAGNDTILMRNWDGADKLEFSKSVFAGLTGTGTLSAEQFWSGAGVTSAHDADDRFICDTSIGALYCDADGAGGVAAVQVALLGTLVHSGLVHGDIIVGH